jgi:hypothetical protein
MATLLCFGLGYSAQHYMASYGGRFEHVWATVRDAQRAVVLNSYARPRITTLVFDGKVVTVDLRSAITQAEAVLVSVPPDASTRRSDCRMTCANCGDLLIAPEWSEYKDEHHVLNLWSSSKCGIECETEAFVPGGVESGEDKSIKTFFPSLLVA